MTVVVLDGAAAPRDAAKLLAAEVEQPLGGLSKPVRSFRLAGFDNSQCMGVFDCFVKTPGRCRIHDEEPRCRDRGAVLLLFGGAEVPAAGSSPTTWTMWCSNEPNQVSAKDRAVGEVPACPGRLTGPRRFRLHSAEETQQRDIAHNRARAHRHCEGPP